MNVKTSEGVYRDLIAACSKIDRRHTDYRFDIDLDIPWNLADRPGLHFGPSLLRALSLDLADLTPDTEAIFQWAYAASVCETFHELENMVVRFTDEEQAALGPSRSVQLLNEEERKHMALFARYRDVLMARRPDLAAHWEALPRSARLLPGDEADRAAFPGRESQHYIFWINTLFFEEFTIFLARGLAADSGLIQPVWASMHACHLREELQHLPTDLVHLRDLALDAPKRLLLSKAFVFGVETGFERFFGLDQAFALLARACPQVALPPRPSFRDLPLFHEILTSETFQRTRESAPYLAELAHQVPATPEVGPGLALLTGPPLARNQFATLPDVLVQAARNHSDLLVTCLDEAGHERSESYAALLERGRSTARGLTAAGIKPGDLAILALDDPHAFLGAFWGALIAGVVPVPVGLPVRSDDARRAAELQRLHRHLGAPVVLADDAATAQKLIPGARLLSTAALETGGPALNPARLPAEALAFLQFSSGSTGDPRGAAITHANAISNVAAITRHLQVTSGDVTVSWMPLHHDMGLCLHVASTFMGLPQTLLPPRLFARRPRLWLQKLSACRATITAAPDFGLALAARWLGPETARTLDLSSLRCLLNGAEPISPRHLTAFVAAARPAGLAEGCIVPCYGLAEATTAVTLSVPGHEVQTRWVLRSSMGEGLEVREAAAEAPGASPLVAVGGAIPGTALRIVAADGKTVAAGVVGEIEIRGPNVASGYWNDSLASLRAKHGDWLRTGDLGFVLNGLLFVAGRKKDVIFANGRKFHAADLEAALLAMPAMAGHRLAVVGSHDPGAGHERVLVFLERRKHAETAPDGLERQVSATLSNLIAYPVHRVIDLGARRLPLSTSGKIRRALLREAFERGDFEPIRPDAPPAAADPGEAHVRGIVLAIWSDVLGLAVTEIPTDCDFFDLGGDSLKAMEVHGCLEDRWGRLLDQKILFDCRTVRDQVEFLLRLPSPLSLAAPEVPAPVPPPVPEHGVAIIAMAGRFPGAPDLDGFWQLLRHGQTAFREPPSDRWSAERFYSADPRKPGTTVCRTGAFLDDIRRFDALANGLSEAEARQADPQQRLFLETVHDLLDQVHLGTRHIGVFAGAAENEYFSRQALSPETINPLSAQSNLANMLAARIAQQMGFTGPALGLDAACATSLIAVHYACRSLESGECDLAIAGGAQINLSEVSQLIFSQAGVLSPRGLCTPFAQGADGFVPGEGVGAVLLKPLDKAIADGDPILGILRGSAVNNDGGAISGMAPNPAGQQNVIRAALDAARVTPRDISHVETHGAGTQIGDLVEARALIEVFGGNPAHSIALGAAKANVGHLFHAAGICSLIKVLLSMRHEELVPVAGCAAPDPRIRFDQTPIYPVQSVTVWPRRADHRRIAGISAFGVGGTNCHLIVEEPPLRRPIPSAQGPRLLLLSAPSAADLPRVAAAFAAEVERTDAAPLAQLCAAQNPRARRFRHRLALVADSTADLAIRLQDGSRGTGTLSDPKLVFLFPGPSGLYHGMARHLLDDDTFRAALADCDRVMEPRLGQPLARILTDQTADFTRIELAQPVSFALCHAMTAWLGSLNLRPDAVIGHSGGEYAAAYAAGALPFEDALRLSLDRGALMARAEAGRMAAIEAGEAEVRAALRGLDGVEIVCVNSGLQTVIAGRSAPVAAALDLLAERGLAGQVLDLACAAHSALMDPVLPNFAAVLNGLRSVAPSLPFFSSVTGQRQAKLDPAYWLPHLREPVRFDRALQSALLAGYRVFLDLGPTATMARHATEIAASQTLEGTTPVTTLGLLRKSIPGWRQSYETLGRLFELGAEVDTRWLDRGQRGDRRLPPYPYQRSELWITQKSVPHLAPAERSSHEAGWRHDLLAQDAPWIADHEVFGQGSAPSGLLLDLVLRAGNPGGRPCVLHDILLERPLRTWAEGRVQLRVQREEDRLRLGSAANGSADLGWHDHLSCRLEFDPAPAATEAIAEVLSRCPFDLSPLLLSDSLAWSGMTQGPSLHTIRAIKVGDHELVVALDAASAGPSAAFHMLDPGIVDGAMRSVGAFTLTLPGATGAPYLAFTIRKAAIHAAVRGLCQAHVRLDPDCPLTASSQVIRFDLAFHDPAGHLLALLEGVSLKRLTHPPPPEPDAPFRCFALDWRSAPAGSVRPVPRNALLIARPSGWRAEVERDLDAAGSGTLCLAPPRDPAQWHNTLDSLRLDGDTAMETAVVIETASVDELAAFVSAILTRGATGLARLLVLTADASAAAFARCLAKEFPAWNCRAVELLSGSPEAAAVVGELRAASAESSVAWRDGTRLIRDLMPVAVPAAEPLLKPRGVYWITGGLGAVGSSIAGELLRSLQARLLLTGRGTHSDQGRLAELGTLGGEVLYRAADVRDPVAMRATHAAALARWGRIDGVIHAAGQIGDRLLAFRQPGEGNEVMATKLDGARILAEITQGERLDFLALFSSLVAVTGQAGQADYAAANAALDRLAIQLHAEGRPAVSIAWGPWSIGMAAPDKLQAAYRAMGLKPFSARDGARAFIRALRTDHPHLAILDMDARKETDLVALIRPPAGVVEPARRVVPELPPPAEAKVWQVLQPILARHLRLDAGQVIQTAPIQSLGIDSLMAVEIALELQTRLKLRIYPTLLLEVATLGDLVERIEALRRPGGQP